MPIKPLGEIYDVLSRAGVVTQTGRMVVGGGEKMYHYGGQRRAA
jgi:hypothetical protein